MLRISGSRKVKRMDLEKDVGVGYTPHYVEKHGLRRCVSRITKSRNSRATVDYDFVPLMHPSAIGIAVKVGYFAKGAERAAYEMTEIAAGPKAVGQALVGKFSLYEEASQIEFHKRCALTQSESGRLAHKFNERLNELQRMHNGIFIPHIDFLPVWFYEWRSKTLTPVTALLCEKRLDPTRFKKWNDNKGGVFNVNKTMAPNGPLATIGEDDEDDEDDEQEGAAPLSKSRLTAAQMTRIIDEDVPQAFSHWTYDYTKSHSLVCDVQGVLDKSFQLTDPAIHSSAQRFGPTDHGKNGQRLFFSTHECNPLCDVLNLKHPNVAKGLGRV